jgi:S-formylglutathione hydrolase
MATAAVLDTATLPTRLVPSPVTYRLLRPAAPAAAPGPAPALMLCLHGGLGGADLLEQMAPTFQAMWTAAALPEMLVVTPEARQSLYLDYRDGSQRWETFIVTELLPHVRAVHGASRERGRTVVGGVSMGGLGALRLGLKHVGDFGVVVAWEPAIEPALCWTDVRLEDRFWRPQAMLEERFGRPLDEAYWADNNPATLVSRHAEAIRRSDVRIYLEAGTDDVYGLHRGAEHLHRLLYDRGVAHEYRSVYGADHVGATLDARFRDGLGFVARMLGPTAPDPRVTRLRELVAGQKRRAGLPAGARS